MYTKNEPLLKRLEEKEVLVACHRGTCGGNLCQNNRLSYIASLLHGADMVEMDVIQSTDGVWYAYHNGTEKVNLDINEDLRTLSSAQIDELQYYNWIHMTSGVKVAKMEDILDEFEPQCLINIDRAWLNDWAALIDLLSKRPNHQSVLLKSPPEDELLKILEDSGSDVMYMPIVRSVEQWNNVKKYNINVAAVEVIFDNVDHELVQPEMFKEWEELGVIPWVNVISLGNEPRFNINAYLDDNNAIANGYDENWGAQIRMGFKILQTDWPGLVNQYLDQRKNK